MIVLCMFLYFSFKLTVSAFAVSVKLAQIQLIREKEIPSNKLYNLGT